MDIFFLQEVSPEVYGRVYAEKVAENIGGGLEVRIGLHTQHLPIFVRMLDKDSVVGYENGLKSLIPTALVFGVLGYPFVLPDMIGGNAYKNSTTQTGDLLGRLIFYALDLQFDFSCEHFSTKHFLLTVISNPFCCLVLIIFFIV